MPALPICCNWACRERPFASVAKYRFSMHVEEASSTLLTDRFLSNVEGLTWCDRFRLGVLFRRLRSCS
jgi:hypothetical protein